jgi:hypothetical protein
MAPDSNTAARNTCHCCGRESTDCQYTVRCQACMGAFVKGVIDVSLKEDRQKFSEAYGVLDVWAGEAVNWLHGLASSVQDPERRSQVRGVADRLCQALKTLKELRRE